MDTQQFFMEDEDGTRHPVPDHIRDMFGGHSHNTDSFRDCDFDFSADTGTAEDGDFWQHLDSEKSFWQSYLAVEEFDPAEETAVPESGRGAKRKRKPTTWEAIQQRVEGDRAFDEVVYLTDYEEGIERDTLALIYGHFSLIFHAKNEKDPLLEHAVGFIFSDVPYYENGPTIELAVHALAPEARVNLLRLRLLYDLWYVGWKMPPLNPMKCHLPNCLVDLMEIRFRRSIDRAFREGSWTADDCKIVMTELWESIGTTPDALYNNINLYREMPPERFTKVLDFLIDERIVSVQTKRKKSIRSYGKSGDKWEILDAPRLYLTGENPIRLVEDVWENERRRVDTTFMTLFGKFVY